MSKEENIKHFKLRRKRHENSECPICSENKELYEFDCGDNEHCYCFDCYKHLDKCPNCRIPKNSYYSSLFAEEVPPLVPPLVPSSNRVDPSVSIGHTMSGSYMVPGINQIYGMTGPCGGYNPPRVIGMTGPCGIF